VVTTTERPAPLTALSDGTRVAIVEALAEADRGVSELVELFPVSQPAISRHLRVLRDAGLVLVEPRGKQRIYRLNPGAVREVGSWAETCCRRWEARFDVLGDHLDRMAAERRKQAEQHERAEQHGKERRP
jgi:DNA-binding transcriptional ArsR family regulator